MEIIVHQAILHVLDTTLDAPVLSGSCMEMTAEKTAYLQYHIEKLLASDDIRQCRPLPDSAFRYELEQNKDFIDLSCRIAGVLFDYMHAHTTIPGADLAVVDFTRDGQPWLGILKLNYKNGYTHYTESVDGAPLNSITTKRLSNGNIASISPSVTVPFGMSCLMPPLFIIANCTFSFVSLGAISITASHSQFLTNHW